MAIDFQHHYVPLELNKGYRFGTLSDHSVNTSTCSTSISRDSKGVCPRLIVRCRAFVPERLVFASDYPQDFSGVNTDTGRGMKEINAYIDAVRGLDLREDLKEGILGGTAARLLKLSPVFGEVSAFLPFSGFLSTPWQGSRRRPRDPIRRNNRKA